MGLPARAAGGGALLRRAALRRVVRVGPASWCGELGGGRCGVAWRCRGPAWLCARLVLGGWRCVLLGRR